MHVDPERGDSAGECVWWSCGDQRKIKIKSKREIWRGEGLLVHMMVKHDMAVSLQN
jgi:hypothetical protein